MAKSLSSSSTSSYWPSLCISPFSPIFRKRCAFVCRKMLCLYVIIIHELACIPPKDCSLHHFHEISITVAPTYTHKHERKLSTPYLLPYIFGGSCASNTRSNLLPRISCLLLFYISLWQILGAFMAAYAVVACGASLARINGFGFARDVRNHHERDTCGFLPDSNIFWPRDDDDSHIGVFGKERAKSTGGRSEEGRGGVEKLCREEYNNKC